MKIARNTVLGACLALPLLAATGHAQTIETQGRTIEVPPGAVVLILPGPGVAPQTTVTPTADSPAAVSPAAMPMLRLIAEQQAAMQRMMANMNAMFPPMPPMPDPTQLLRAAFGAGGPMLRLAGGPGMCSESISIVQHGNAAPVITRTASAACGAPAAAKPDNVRALPPAPARPHAPHVLEVSYPPHPLAGQPPRT